VSTTVARSDFEFIRRLVRERSAIVLDDGKEYLLDARLGPVLRASGLESVSGLISSIRGGREDLRDLVVEAMTTNETSFFRDMVPFEVLERKVLPELVERKGDDRSLTLWCAACSSGQEPYSVAIALLESDLGFAQWSVRIDATDINRKMVERVREGTYSQLEVNRGLRAPQLLRHFDRRGVKWTVKSRVRDMVHPECMNLVEPWSKRGPYDVVFLRNVLIYFEPHTKRAILDRIVRVMNPGGHLFLGGAETTVGVHEGFERMPYPKASCYRLKETP